MPKIEYKLFRTKSKLSNLLSSLSPQQNKTQTSYSYYILIEFKKDTNNDNDSNINVNCDDSGVDGIWFNRNNGDISFQKSKSKSQTC